MIETLVLDVILLGLVVLVAIATVFTRNLLAAAAFMAIYSLLLSAVWANMYALDVAFTEAAVGAGISTILMIGALVITGIHEKPGPLIHWPAALMCLLVGGFLAWGTMDMPRFGDPDAPIHNRVFDGYVNQNVGKPAGGLPGQWHDDEPADADHAGEGDFGHHSPNLVTAVLADYRGYDTLFETAVIFTAGLGVILLLRRREFIPLPRRRRCD